MHRASQQDIPLEGNAFSGLNDRARRITFALFLMQFALVWFRVALPHSPPSDAVWPEALLLLFTSATLLVSLGRNLPLQNVVMISGIIAFISGLAVEIGAVTGIPFGSFAFTSEIGRRLFDLPWSVPLIWIIALLTSRGTGQLMLRPWRHTTNYGYWLLGLTTALVVWFDIGLDTFATKVKHFWHWTADAPPPNWYGAPWTNFFAWALLTVASLLLLTPWLIIKKPGDPPPPHRQPAIVWLLLNFLFLTGCVANRLWLGATVILAGGAVVGIFSLRGARGRGDPITGP